MADLETAGTDLLEKIKELMKDFPSDQKAFEECEEKLDKARNDVEEDFDVGGVERADSAHQLADGVAGLLAEPVHRESDAATGGAGVDLQQQARTTPVVVGEPLDGAVGHSIPSRR